MAKSGLSPYPWSSSPAAASSTATTPCLAGLIPPARSHAAARLGQGIALGGRPRQEQDQRAGFQRWIGERDARLRNALPDHGRPALPLLEHRLARQQGGRYAIIAQPQQDQVKQRARRIPTCRRHIAGAGSRHSGRRRSGACRRWECSRASWPDKVAGQQGLGAPCGNWSPCRPAHEAFVAEEEFGAIPVDVLTSEQLISGARGRPPDSTRRKDSWRHAKRSAMISQRRAASAAPSFTTSSVPAITTHCRQNAE